jgi:hypothetical protein
LSGQGNYHQKNQTADYGSVSAGWREWFGEGRRFSVSYYRLPHYYLRQLYDPDAPVAFPGLARFRYHRAEFQLDIASVAWSQRIAGKTSVELEYQFEHRGYNPDFRERDSDVHQGTARWSAARLPRRGSFAIFAGYRSSGARAGSYRDPLSASGETLAAYPDVSYHGLVSGLEAGIEIARSRRWRLGADLAYELETRGFDSSIPSDRFHFGRNDVLNTVEVGLRVSPRRHWSARGSYRWEDNHASLASSGSSGTDPGSYRVQQGTLAVEWSGTVWRHASASETRGEP